MKKALVVIILSILFLQTVSTLGSAFAKGTGTGDLVGVPKSLSQNNYPSSALSNGLFSGPSADSLQGPNSGPSESTQMSVLNSSISDVAIQISNDEGGLVDPTVRSYSGPVTVSGQSRTLADVQPTGSTTAVFSETFEGVFPGDNWWTGDSNSNNGLDYWDDTNYRYHYGSWSGWCAQVGDNSVYGGTNVAQHKYDNYMDAYMWKKYVVGMSTWDIGYVDFWARWDTETNYDYLIAQWYGTDAAWHDDSNFKLTGTSSGSWNHFYWRIPDTYLISSGAFGFKFHSDGSNVNEGVYLDDIYLVSADVTLDNSYISPTSVHPGETFTAYYYVNNPCPFSTIVGLGLSIRTQGGTTYNDPAHDTQVTIASGSSWVSRQFTVPSSAPFGIYDVIWGIHSKTPGTGGREWGYRTVTQGLTVAGWPDLMWPDIYTSPSPPTGGQSAGVYSQLKNQGSGDAPAGFRNYFYLDGSYLGYADDSGLPAGGIHTYGGTLTLGPGYHDHRAVADVTNIVAESNENNNDFTKRIWWKGPDLIVYDLWWIDAYGTRNPTITSGQPFTVYLTIKNNGDADAVGQFGTYLTVGAVTSNVFVTNGLSAGATANYQLPNVVVSSISTITLTCTVDYQNNIAEANTATGSGIGTGESNNQKTAAISIQKAKWAVITYFAADNNLEAAEIDDFNQLAQAGSTIAVSIACQMDRIPGYDTRYGDWTDSKRFYINRGVTPDPSNALQSLGETSTGNPQTLIDFANWAIDRYQADRYVLVIDDHGGSWVGCAQDFTDGTLLSISGMKTAFSAISSHLGRHIDLIWFDDCLMSSIEIAYQTYSYADYMAGSETIGWTSTWDYSTVASYLNANPTVSSQNLAIQIVNLGVAVDSATYVTQSISAIDLSKIPNLVSTANSLATQMKNNMHGWRSQVPNARKATSCLEGPSVQRIVDLKQLCSNLKTYVSDSTVKSLAQSIMDQIGPAGGAIGYVVMKEKHSSAASFCNGMSIYFPDTLDKYESSYTSGNDFASSTQWDEFLAQYYARKPDLIITVTTTDPSPPIGGQPVRIWFALENVGDADATQTFTNKFYVDGVYVSFQTQDGLTMDMSVLIYYDTTLGPGYHVIRAVADGNGNVPEWNEGNNENSKQIWWLSPDLIVQSLSCDPSSPLQNQPFTVYCTIKNQGDYGTSATFHTKLYVDGNLYYDWTKTGGLGAGATYPFSTSCTLFLAEGAHTLMVIVDSNNEVSEANKESGSGIGTGETNNQKQLSITVILPYDVTVAAQCNVEGAVSVAIAEDGSPSGFSTSHTFAGLSGSHTFGVPGTDAGGHAFKQWSTGSTSLSITVSSGGTYTAYYEYTYDVTVAAQCNVEGAISVPISPSGFLTPHTFTGLSGSNTFDVPATDGSGHAFKQWSTGSTSLSITVSSGGTYTAYYEGQPVSIQTWYWTSNTYIQSVAKGDVDADGKTEIVTGGYYFDGARDVAQLCVWNGATLALKTVQTWYWTGDTRINSVAVGDVDADGKAEIVTGGYYFDGARDVAQLCVWDGATLALKNVRAWYWTSDTCIYSIAKGDVDADGKVEIVTGGWYFDGARDVAQLCVWDGATLALKNVQTWYWTSKTYVYSVAVGDVDSDSKTEIVTGGWYFDGARYVAQVCVWDGATFALKNVKTWYWTSDTRIYSVAVGDVDGDGKAEIVTGGCYNDGARDVAQLCVWDGATFAPKNVKTWYWTSDTCIYSVAVGDVDADGKAEIVAGGSYYDGTRFKAQLCVWDGATLALKTVQTWYWTGNTRINSVAIGDVDSDSKTEIVTRGFYSDGTRDVAQLCVWA